MIKILFKFHFFLLFLILFSCNDINDRSEKNSYKISPPERVIFGRYDTRGILTKVSKKGIKKYPVIILIPGTGAIGPEEMVPPELTLDGKAHALFSELSLPFHQTGFYTLGIGKPGVEFYGESSAYYDYDLYLNTLWSDYIYNAADAVAYVKSLTGVDADRVYILGHSQGTRVAVDYAYIYKDIKGIILLGYVGQDISTNMAWQLFRANIEEWVEPDIDADHNNFVTRSEADAWPDFTWSWLDGQTQISFNDIEADNRLKNQAIYDAASLFPLYSGGIFTRGPNYALAAALTIPVYGFNGTLDVQTHPRELLNLKAVCDSYGKADCYINIVAGLGHGFSEPKGPRKQRYADRTVGPIDPMFMEILYELGMSIN